jgi:acyl carrier protein
MGRDARDRRLQDIFVRTFELPAGTDCTDLEYRRETRWDSVAHLQLITEVEQEFGVTIENDDVLLMTSYRNILDVLQRLGA